MDIYQKALAKHADWQGKISTELKCKLEDRADLALAYTPGVAEPCRAIHKDPQAAYTYTWKANTVAVISDGTAVLGLGDIGPQAALPVMEGKCCLFKAFAGINAVPVVLDTKNPDELVSIIKAMAPTYGGINLEDISAPRCIEIERRLKEDLDIPVFHDDQHGTAIVVTAGLINALKLIGKNPKACTCVISGTGAAGSSIIHMLNDLGMENIYAFNIDGLLNRNKLESYGDFLSKELALVTNRDGEDLTLAQAMAKADIFVGVSAPNLVTKSMVASMKQDPIVFAMANPEPEISYQEAKEAGARIAGTGRSDFPNQINNVLAFPGLFKGALEAKATKITEEMKLAAAQGLAGLIADEDLSDTYIIPDAFDPRVADTVAKAVADKAIELGLTRQ